MKITIKITKEVLERSKLCGLNIPENRGKTSGENCAIALVIREIFPTANVHSDKIVITSSSSSFFHCVYLSEEIQKFIKDFDMLISNPDKRLELPEKAFDIEIPTKVLEMVDITEVYRILSQSKSLQLANMDQI